MGSPYATRRQALLDTMGSKSAAVFIAGHEKVRSNDTDHTFRAASDVVYLTGFEEPETIVVFAPESEHGPFVMFVRPKDKLMETWTGRRAGVEGAVERFGADSAFPLSDLEEKLPELLAGADTLYHTLGVDAGLDALLLKVSAKLRSRRDGPPQHFKALRDVRDLTHPMRLIKDAHEIDLMRRACAISAEAHTAAMRACRPGMHEYELQALIEYIFMKNGALAPAYTSIVGAGENATILHYTENRSIIQESDLVLIDAGAEYRYYAGDITRTFPASGRFSGPQRDLYQAVLEAEKAAVALCTPGRTRTEIHEATVRNLTQSLVDLKILEGDVDALVEDRAYRAFYMHGTGHWLGMDVHDVGGGYTRDDTPHTLAAGMIQTIEPGIYIEPGAEGVPEAFHGIGIRIEDDVLTTEDGYEVLTSDVVKEVEDIEALVGTGYTLSV